MNLVPFLRIKFHKAFTAADPVIKVLLRFIISIIIPASLTLIAIFRAKSLVLAAGTTYHEVGNWHNNFNSLAE